MYADNTAFDQGTNSDLKHSFIHSKDEVEVSFKIETDSIFFKVCSQLRWSWNTEQNSKKERLLEVNVLSYRIENQTPGKVLDPTFSLLLEISGLLFYVIPRAVC